MYGFFLQILKSRQIQKLTKKNLKKFLGKIDIAEIKFIENP